jgi:hypothetical protein
MNGVTPEDDDEDQNKDGKGQAAALVTTLQES